MMTRAILLAGLLVARPEPGDPALLRELALPPAGLGEVGKPPDLKGTDAQKYADKGDRKSAFRAAVRQAQVLLWATTAARPPKELAAAVGKLRKELKVAPAALRARWPAPATPQQEAALKRQLAESNVGIARLMYRLEAALEGLKKADEKRDGEPPRWRAHHDLVSACLLARLAYLEEHSLALGSMRKELPPREPKHKAWELTATAGLHDLTSKKLAKEARKRFDRLVRDHPGTAWAELARRYDTAGLGVQWKAVE